MLCSLLLIAALVTAKLEAADTSTAACLAEPMVEMLVDAAIIRTPEAGLCSQPEFSTMVRERILGNYEPPPSGSLNSFCRIEGGPKQISCTESGKDYT